MKIIACSISAFIVCALLSCQRVSTPKAETLEDDYAIYSVVIQERYVTGGVKRIVIAEHTMMDLPPVMMGMTQFGNSPEMQKLRNATEKVTMQDYEQKNKSPLTLEKRFSLKVLLDLISEAERDRIFLTTKKGKEKTGNPRGFDEFNRLYRDSPGFMTVSRVGFNSNRTQALVYVAHLCGGLCGSGQFFLLAKEGNTWKIQHDVTAWVS